MGLLFFSLHLQRHEELSMGKESGCLMPKELKL